MVRGPAIVIQGSIFGCVMLVIVLLSLTAGFTLPPPSTASASEVTSQVQNPQEVPNNTDNPSEYCQVSNQYPEKILQWCSLITHYSNKRGLNPDLIAALIWQESGGNPVVYSKSGAVGLMQVMPRDGLAATFICVNGPCFENRPTIAELNDPEFNISYGTKMLSGLLVKNGNIRNALKAYGPMDTGYYYADKVLGIYESYHSQ
ncbi:MAG: lytic transglycosylase domain-containing protein [Chloroflexota bacterium]|nr:lytic transglycosylase domain-containing protein [Chloroflexota bacterium]